MFQSRNHGLWFTAPTSSTNPEEEDIDIVGCEGDNNGNKTNTSGNLSSSESSRDLQLHVYGPPQFTEADVLACMNALEQGDDQDEDMDNLDKKSEAVSAETLTPEQPTIKREMDSENESEVMMPNADKKDTEVDNKENIKDKSKCLKCLVSIFDLLLDSPIWTFWVYFKIIFWIILPHFLSNLVHFSPHLVHF